MTNGTPDSSLQPHRGVLILVLGILSIICCLVTGIVAWIMANKDLQAMAAGQMDRTGEGLTKAGKICGIIGIVLQSLYIIGYVLVVFVFAAAGMAASQQ
jgi:hypothetical protein